jgi:transcriptional regulator with GAF, ATPase, and Fis domain
MTEPDSTGADDLNGRAVRVAESFVALADTLVEDFDVVELLDRLVADCVDLLDVSGAGILLMTADRSLDVVASSDEASQLTDVLQVECQAGPAVDAVRTSEPVAVTDLAELTRRWPDFARVLGNAGYSTVYAIPMRLRARTIGALSLFHSAVAPLAEFDRRFAQAMADVATIGILQHRAVENASVLVTQLQGALDTRIVVEQAKGVIAEFGGLDMGAAFDALRSYARNERVKLSAVAQSLVTRELDPGAVVAPRADT